MSRIKNPAMACAVLSTSVGELTFDAEGVAEATEEQAEALLALNGYTAVDDDGNELEVETVTDESESQLKSDPSAPEDEATDNGGETEDTKGDEGTDEVTDAEGVAEATEEQAENELEAKFKSMNVPQLKKYAKDNNIDLMGATKKDEILPILIGSLM